MAWNQRFATRRLPLDATQKGRAALGAALGILAVALGAAWLLRGGPAHGHAMLAAALVAPMGASAVLVFAVPSSPLAQPWSVIGGNTLSALAGIACAAWVPDVSLAAGLAAGWPSPSCWRRAACIRPGARRPC